MRQSYLYLHPVRFQSSSPETGFFIFYFLSSSCLIINLLAHGPWLVNHGHLSSSLSYRKLFPATVWVVPCARCSVQNLPRCGSGNRSKDSRYAKENRACRPRIFTKPIFSWHFFCVLSADHASTVPAEETNSIIERQCLLLNKWPAILKHLGVRAIYRIVHREECLPAVYLFCLLVCIRMCIRCGRRGPACCKGRHHG